MDILTNFPLWAALTAICFAQVIKVPLQYIATKKFDWTLIFSTGGMPSSHSGAVSALATAIALEEGLGSPFFAISAIFGVVVMFDASGVRRHAGEQATVLNKLVDDFNNLLTEVKSWPKKEEPEKRKKLKELLGHQPIEVIFGCLTGILLTIFLDFLIH